MKWMLLLALLAAPLGLLFADERRIGEQPNRDSVVQQINSVTVLNFQTDKPITEMRLTMNGKQVDATTVRTTETGLWLVIVPMNERMEVQIKAGTENHLLTAKWPMLLDAMTREQKSYGPCKTLTLDKWIEVFTINRITLEGKSRGSLKLEIR
ncbi:MAG: hypothetical protein WC708_05025 [Lentisphaeria bacterium]